MLVNAPQLRQLFGPVKAGGAVPYCDRCVIKEGAQSVFLLADWPADRPVELRFYELCIPCLARMSPW
jgi:hypothetical protein